MAVASITDLDADGPRSGTCARIFQGATAAVASTGIVLGGISPNTSAGALLA